MFIIKYTRKESVFLMFRNNRCYDRPMNGNGTTFSFQGVAEASTPNMQEFDPNMMNTQMINGGNMTGNNMPPIYVYIISF